MVAAILPVDTRWKRATAAALALLVGGVVPSPLGRRPAFERVGPDKALHFLGHAGFAVTLVDALVGDGVSERPAACLAVCGSAALGALVGRLQRPVPGREPERADFVAGVLGSLAAVGWRLRTPARVADGPGRPTAR